MVFDFAWVADAMGRSGSWDSSKAFSKPTAMRRMTKSVGRNGTCRLLVSC